MGHAGNGHFKINIQVLLYFISWITVLVTTLSPITIFIFYLFQFQLLQNVFVPVGQIFLLSYYCNLK